MPRPDPTRQAHDEPATRTRQKKSVVVARDTLTGGTREARNAPRCNPSAVGFSTTGQSEVRCSVDGFLV